MSKANKSSHSSLQSTLGRRSSRKKFWSKNDGKLSDIEESGEALYRPGSVVKSGDSAD